MKDRRADARQALRLAEANMDAAVRATFPVGHRARMADGGHTYIVLSHGLGRVKVENVHTGKVYWVYEQRLEPESE